MALRPDGRILLGGSSNVPTIGDGYGLVQYDANGNLDTTFGTSNGTTLLPIPTGPVARTG